MDRMKTLGIYALCVILFFVFSNIMIDIAVKAMYNSIDANIEQRDNLKIDLSEARATYVNGYVEGSINNSGEDVERAYVKIDLYSKRDVLLGTKYVKIEDFRKNETRDFRMGFEFTDVDYCNISIVYEVDKDVTEDQFSTTEFRFARLLATIVLITFFG